MAFLEDVWSRNFLNVFATPLRISEYVAGLVAEQRRDQPDRTGRDARAGIRRFGLSFLAYGLLLIPFLLVLFLFGVALGIFASAVVLRLGPGVGMVRLADAGADLAVRRRVLSRVDAAGVDAVVAHALPPSYVFEGMRASSAAARSSAVSLLGGAALAVVYILLAYAFFARVHRHAIRTGLIARYSAETVS